MATRTNYVGTQATGDVLTSANFDKLPGGLVAYAITSTATTGIGTTYTNLTGLSITHTFQTGRMIRAVARVQFTNPSTTPLSFSALLRTSGGAVNYAVMINHTFEADTSGVYMGYGEFFYAFPSGSTSIVLSARTSTGTIDTNPDDDIPSTDANHFGPDFIAFYDVGPSF